jgi:hypothetical protein
MKIKIIQNGRIRDFLSAVRAIQEQIYTVVLN